jgi:photosystem II stability/assembly factor-like uncharacterized protein
LSSFGTAVSLCFGPRLRCGDIVNASSNRALTYTLSCQAMSYQAMSYRLHLSVSSLRFIASALLVVASVCSSAQLDAQQTGEWLVVDSTHQGSGNSIPKLIAASAPGHYVVVTHENSLVGPYVIWRTTDAGTTWKSVRSDSGDNWRITGIAHPTPDVIVAAAMSRVPAGGGSGSALMNRPSILRSSDAGATWQRIDLRDSNHVDGIAMCDALTGAVVSYRWLTSGRRDLMLYTTDDGGLTWTERPTGGGTAITADRVACRANGSYLVPAYDSEAKLSIALHTSDEGRTWKRSPMPDIASIDFIDSANGWGVAGIATGVGDTRRDFMAKTTDGGATWSTIIDSLIDFRWGLASISFADRMHGIAVGFYGKILRTTDGGSTWIRDWPSSEKVAEYIDLHGVAHGAPDEALALSTYALVLRYSGRQRLAAPWITAPRENPAELPFDVTLEWTPVRGAQWYDVQVGDTTFEFNYVDHRVFDAPYIDVRGLTTTSLQIQLAPRTRYTFRVRARNESDSSDWSIRLSTISRAAGQTLTAPLFTLPSMGAKSVAVPTRFEWTAIPGATAYDMLIADNPAFVGPSLVEIHSAATNSASAPLMTGTTYWAIVRARNATEVGAWSNVAQGKLTFTTAATSAVELEGSDLDGAVTIVPNPAKGGRASIEIRGGRGATSVTLVDMAGRVLRELINGAHGPGGHTLDIDIDELPAGLYYAIVGTDAGRIAKPLFVVR